MLTFSPHFNQNLNLISEFTGNQHFFLIDFRYPNFLSQIRDLHQLHSPFRALFWFSRARKLRCFFFHNWEKG